MMSRQDRQEDKISVEKGNEENDNSRQSGENIYKK